MTVTVTVRANQGAQAKVDYQGRVAIVKTGKQEDFTVFHGARLVITGEAVQAPAEAVQVDGNKKAPKVANPK